MNRLYKIFRGSILNVSSLLINLCILLFLMPFIIETLGDRMYGLWALASALMGYYLILDLGISQAVNRFIAKAVGGKNEKQISKIISNSIYIFSILGAIVFVISIILLFVCHLLIPADLLTIAKVLILVIGLNVAFSLPLRTYHGILSANLDFDFLSLSEIIKTLIRTFLIYMFLISGYGIIAMAIINFIFDILYFVVLYIFTRVRYPQFRFNKALIEKKEIKKLIDFSKYVFFGNLGDLFRYKMGQFLIGIYLGLSSVTIYTIAQRIIEYFTEIIIRVLSVITPLFSQYFGAKDYKNLKEKYVTSLRLLSLISLFITANLIIFGERFIEIWVGPEYSFSYVILAILAFSTGISLITSPSNGVLKSINKHKYYTYINSLEALFNFIIVLSIIRDYGLLGVAIGTSIPLIILKVFVLPVITCRLIKLNLGEMLRPVLASIVKMIVFFVVIYYIRQMISISNIFIMAAIIGIELLLYAAYSYFVILNPQEKNYIQKIRKRYLSK